MAGGDPRAAGAPFRRRQQEVGEARLPSALTMDSSRAGLCPGRLPSRPELTDAAGCSSQRGLEMGRRGARMGDYADATGDS